MHQISDPQIVQTLDQLHREASSQKLVLMKGLAKSVIGGLRPENMKEAYLAISKSQGEFLYDLLIQKKATHIVEFGTSFGISTIYLAAAAKENDGKVITSELLPEKCEVARRNFETAGLTDWIDLRQGDALQTLKDIDEAIDLLLLDGWNDLYLPLFELLSSKLPVGSLIYTDNASFAGSKPFFEFLASHPDKYKSRRIHDKKGGAELTEVIR